MVRIKERYLLVNILYPRDGTPIKKNPGDGKEIPDFVAIRHATQSDLTPQLLLRAIKAETLALFGDCGAGSVERTLSVKYFNRSTSTFILRITRDHFRYVWTALTFMNSVPVRNGPSCVFHVARVSGTIRKVEEEAIRQARALILATKEYMAGNTTSAFEMLTLMPLSVLVGRGKSASNMSSSPSTSPTIPDAAGWFGGGRGAVPDMAKSFPRPPGKPPARPSSLPRAAASCASRSCCCCSSSLRSSSSYSSLLSIQRSWISCTSGIDDSLRIATCHTVSLAPSAPPNT
ncbi:rpp14 family protein [Ophiostoma piceae UAMH 11346]|uniref:Rpp14 family protein n=1 Tax=Ophiostoma piceae (strain UAMH 11346) TaxID=1262450 RepID=S3D0Y0_OPHP1|nr:rpp14 family protein [Ophiostoma piceae UAMH 11346]